MKVLYVDESGDHNFVDIDDDYSVFVLGGVIIDDEYAKGPLTNELNEFKYQMFGRTNIVLHTADIVRNRKGFEQMTNGDFREEFYSKLNDLMRRADYRVLAVTIEKKSYLDSHGVAALDPYMLGMFVLVEQFCKDVGKVENEKQAGMIVAETRGPVLDKNLSLAWENIKTNGTRLAQAKEINNRITELRLRSKSDNLAGLQLADLVVSPIGRHVLGKVDKEDWRIVEAKFRRGDDGKTEGFGLISLPKKSA